MTRLTTFTSLCYFLVALLSLSVVVDASAIPTKPLEVKVKRDVWSPKILEPTDGTVWRAGESVKVIWSTDNPPTQVTNSNGMIALRTTNGFLQGPGGLGEPLASNFSLYDGSVTVQVPDVPGRDDYQAILFGDSGNESPFFTIANSMMLAPALPAIPL